MIVTGTEGGQWGDICYVSSVFRHHIAGNLNVFKRIKHLVGVETRSGESNFLFTRGIGVVEIKSSNEMLRIQSVFYAPELDQNVLSLDQLTLQGYTVNFLFTRGIGVVEIKSSNEMLRIQSVFYAPELDQNVLSLDQLTLQGYTVNKSGDTCKIFPMFSTLVTHSVNNMNGLTKEEELGLKEKKRVIDASTVNDEYKEKYLNSYFEDLNPSSQEPDWSQMIIHAMEFHDFTDCKSLLDMMEDGEFMFKYKHELETKFEEMLTWFIEVKLGITTRPIPPYASDNRKVDLLGLYMVVKRDRGYRTVTDTTYGR
ncbi:hypothetical protein HanHA300_Chr01g0033931 [Helianthus annuus]|nr:hypothetical protein HanHA300_Chr01g0033931 [Helianthus annuus]KAJ0958564.1 hypothetical protein HanPSC8_Chr01g0040381 [Helianthus annuus]